jgi:hypothetical protein
MRISNRPSSVKAKSTQRIGHCLFVRLLEGLRNFATEKLKKSEGRAWLYKLCSNSESD